ncbi:glycosyltransferase [hydrocarbon metagenome]|uniref:Glycosyltransferase n=1 Tax=hydrocarbon metagenome TaxID=938273 RepID=A0A0W8E3F2_9ZZZZ
MLTYQHFLNLTDETGMLQFSRLNKPDPDSGHTLDDNARALMLAISMDDGHDLAMKYVSFMDSCQQKDGSWSNLLLQGRFTSLINSEDSIGRALLACSLGSMCQWEDISTRCREIFQTHLPRVVNFSSPRAIAYTLVALAKGDAIKKVYTMSTMAEYLLNLYQTKKSVNWYWFEDYMTYCNGILPQAMISVYEITGDKRYLKVGLETLNFLNDILFRDGYLNIVGNQGWYQRGQAVPLFDQQPVDAASIAFACHEAYTITAKSEYLDLAQKAHAWYFGDNIKQVSLYDERSGGCYDALTQTGVNLNQGAEAVLSLLMTDKLISSSAASSETVAGKTS